MCIKIDQIRSLHNLGQWAFQGPPQGVPTQLLFAAWGKLLKKITDVCLRKSYFIYAYFNLIDWG